MIRNHGKTRFSQLWPGQQLAVDFFLPAAMVKAIRDTVTCCLRDLGEGLGGEGEDEDAEATGRPNLA